ncbi:MAG TPA: carotenoid oxygenase family protein [Acidimicrobiia bacterium]|jgi:carotenoid cleavage dioxygenase|nr:carotenoid oxygenase family protein [Acidimicrobiia bacterium]
MVRNDALAVALDAGENPYLMGPYAPVHNEIDATDLEVIGEIPADLEGLYVRNGPNPRFRTEGRYHWFDGDGMLHAIYLENGEATYRNRWVRTAGFEQDTSAGRGLWQGIAEPRIGNPDDGSRLRLKDTANTDVMFHNGNLVALWYLSGAPYKVDPFTLETLGTQDWNGTRTSCVMAHAKVDPRSGEFVFFDYGPQPPYMSYGVVSSDGVVKHFTDIEIPGARMPHDMAITENYSILMDLPLVVDEASANAGRHRLNFVHDTPARFGIIPRLGGNEQVRWFEAEPCYIYHSINAYEAGDEIVMDVCRFRVPGPPAIDLSGPLASILNYLRLDAYVHRYRFNLATGGTTEEVLADRNTEFPMIHPGRFGEKNRYAWNVSINSDVTMYFDGLVRYDLETGAEERYAFGAGRYGSEAPFAPRPGATAEDDGYVMSFVYDAATERSELVILDAADITGGPIGRVLLPVRIPNGFHACWVPAEDLDRARAAAR